MLSGNYSRCPNKKSYILVRPSHEGVSWRIDRRLRRQLTYGQQLPFLVLYGTVLTNMTMSSLHAKRHTSTSTTYRMSKRSYPQYFGDTTIKKAVILMSALANHHVTRTLAYQYFAIIAKPVMSYMVVYNTSRLNSLK
eukprot:scaffold174441_cov40-Prasinocladus_malaysianus.AAC.1